MKPSEIYNSKTHMYVLFSIAAIVFLICFAIDIGGTVTADSYAQLYALIADALLCAVYLFASITIMIWSPKNIGRTLLITIGIYAAISGLSGTIINIMNALNTYYYTVPIISAVFSVIQLGVSIMGLILIDHKPKVTTIITLVSYVIVTINNFMNLIACFISGEALLGVVHLLALFLDIAIVVVPILALTKKPYDVDPEVLAEKEDREK